MKAEYSHNPRTMITRVVIEWHDLDLLPLDFTELESATLREPQETIADIIMDVNIIAEAYVRHLRSKAPVATAAGEGKDSNGDL